MKYILSIIFSFVISHNSYAQLLQESIPDFRGLQSQTIKNNYRSDVTEALDDVFQILSETSTISGFNAALLLPDNTIWRGASGLARDTFEEEFMKVTNHMAMGSITKTFVTATIMSMEEDGLLSIDDNIGHYINPYPNIDTSVTIAQLLSHTTGFNDYLNENPNTFNTWSIDQEKIWDLDTLLTYFVLAPNFSPGERWSYSNTNYLLAGKIIENISGKPWYEVTRERVINPLSLDVTYAAPWENKDLELLANPFGDTDGNGSIEDASKIIPTLDGLFSIATSAGNLVSTPSELTKFVKAVYDGTLLSQESIMKMQTNYQFNPAFGLDYGLGTISFDLDTENYGHNGSLIYQSTALYFPEYDIAIAVQQNEARVGGGFIDLNVVLVNLLDAYVTCLTPSSTFDLKENNISIFPNPASDQITISLDNGLNHDIAIKLISQEGSIKRDFNLQKGTMSFSLDTKHLSSGIYYLKIGGLSKKVVITN